MLMITGLGRCGTTMLAQFMDRMGFDVAKGAWYKEMKAGWESPQVWGTTLAIKSHIDYKTGEVDVDQTIKKYGITLREFINQVESDVVKDPRVLIHPSLIRGWWNAKKDIKLLICHRRFEEIWESTRERARSMSPESRLTLEDLKLDFADFFTEVISLGIPWRILLFPRFLQNYDEVHAALGDLGYRFDKEDGRKEWRELVRMDYVHHQDMSPVNHHCHGKDVEHIPSGWQYPPEETYIK